MTLPLTFDNLCHVLEQLGSTSAAPDLRAETALQDIGIDSLSLLNVMLKASKQFGISLKSVSEESDIPSTLGQLHNFLSDLQNEKLHGTA